MINGAFGVGKTTVANGLLTHIPNSMLYDPEEVGQMLKKVTAGVRLADEGTGDFQDIALWPALSVDVAERLYNRCKRPLIIPMTLDVPYFTVFKNGLSRVDPNLYHFCLTASKEVIHQRLAQRGDEPGSWTFQQTERCVAAHRDPIFSEHIDSEDIDSQQIQEYILSRIQPT